MKHLLIISLFLLIGCATSKKTTQVTTITESERTVENDSTRSTYEGSETETVTEIEKTPQTSVFLPCDSLLNVIEGLEFLIGDMEIRSAPGGYSIKTPEQVSKTTTTTKKDTSNTQSHTSAKEVNRSTSNIESNSEETIYKKDIGFTIKVAGITLFLGLLIYILVRRFTPIPLP